jgi:hypothetical protein
LWTDGQIAACLDVLQLTHATIQLVIPNSILLQLSSGSYMNCLSNSYL